MFSSAEVTVITIVPSASGVSTPFALIVASVSLSTDQITFWLIPSGKTVATYCSVKPIRTFDLPVILIPVGKKFFNN